MNTTEKATHHLRYAIATCYTRGNNDVVFAPLSHGYNNNNTFLIVFGLDIINQLCEHCC